MEEPTIIDEAGQTTVAELTENVKALAEAQAAKDAQLMEELKARAEFVSVTTSAEVRRSEKQRRISHAERVQSAQNAAIVAALQAVPLNRAQRRAQTKAFAAMLRAVSR